jgi:acyl-[acyl carrier protein]--UDP-N-acetylglucosamine O-acyltransferase
VVVKDVPPYAIVGGVPARVIRYRYGANVVELMKQIDWGVIDNEFVRGHVDLLYRRPITEDDVRALLGELEIKKKERNG